MAGVIDPALLRLSDRRSATNGAVAPNGLSLASSANAAGGVPPLAVPNGASGASNLYPTRNLSGSLSETREQYEARLMAITRKAPLVAACNSLSIRVPNSATLTRLRGDLIRHWFPFSSALASTPPSQPPNASALPPVPRPRRRAPQVSQRAAEAHDVLRSVLVPEPANPIIVAAPSGSRLLAHPVPHRGELNSGVPLLVSSAPRRSQQAHASSSSRASRAPSHPQPSSALRRPPVTPQRQFNTAPQVSSPLRATPLQHDPEVFPVIHIPAVAEGEEAADEAELLRLYDVSGANASELLSYEDSDDDEEYDDNDEESPPESDDDESGESGDKSTGAAASSRQPRRRISSGDHEEFRIGVRVAAVRRTEGNRRPGGLKTQKAMVRAWLEFLRIALEKGQIRDDIVDELSLLLYIQYCAEREKRTRRGFPIPGTRVGASQLKKMFFGALRIRKEQDARDPDLARNRPATTVVVYDAIKTRMDEALERVRNGLNEGEDAPDIIANTFLSEVTNQQLDRIGVGFLSHPHLCLTIFGHLAWTAQHASGNRGDDFRALKLCELQPYNITHPNGSTAIYSVLGFRAKKRRAREACVINPVYSAFIAHMRPEMCPLGAIALYLHWLYDEKQLTSVMEIDWAINKSWRQVRILHGPKAATVPFNEQSLYNLYCKVYVAAGFNSRLKAHLPRHLLGYKQAEMNVDAAETAKMGWVRGQTYHDTYAPALPRKAILGAAGFRVDESYDPVWRHVRVPEQFLSLVCPMAEEIHAKIVDKVNLSGAANHWAMVQHLRPYVFQCGAALMQKCPDSAIFGLPALANADVRNWMKTEFPTQLSLLQANAGSPVDLTRIQNESLRTEMEELRCISNAQALELKKLRELFERRTAVLSPAKGFSASNYHRNAAVSSSSLPPPPMSPLILHLDENSVETGTYQTEDDSTMRAFVNPSPRTPDTPRATTQVDLILPPAAAFFEPNGPVSVFPPLLGQKSASWPEVFALIKCPALCWPVWGVTKTLEQFADLDELWSVYAVGDPVYNSQGMQTGMKPPLQLVEQYFHSSWRTSDDGPERKRLQKHWQRIREIPEWIGNLSERRHVSPSVIISELNTFKGEKGLNWLSNKVADLRKGAAAATIPVDAPQSLPSSSTTPTQLDSNEGDHPPLATTSTLGPAFVLHPSYNTSQATADSRKGKKRAAAVDARRPSKKPKQQESFHLPFHPPSVLKLTEMGVNDLWEVIGVDRAQKRSLLNFSTIRGFQADKRRLRTLLVDIDINCFENDHHGGINADVIDFDAEELLSAHRALKEIGGVIDLAAEDD
ncbi:hypothetical protein C8J57DRAFT_1622921 [Mycena rebaudengoi]|nr:hypothetical protein C8J57DRAFT_1622921 [Mycena rebaudengoi]